MRGGFTLIETIVVVAIIAIISLASVNTITEFQRNAALDAAAHELASTLRTARTQSVAGSIHTGETAATFSPTGLPTFSITLSGSTYTLSRTYTPAVGPMVTETIETHTIDNLFTVTPSPFTITFARVTGMPSTTMTITVARTTNFRIITVDANGNINL